MLHIAICDDDSIQLKNYKKIVAQAAACYQPEIELFTDGDALIRAVEKSAYRPDIVVLDIELQDSSGIIVAKKINHLCPQCAIIYLTAFLVYATSVYETRHSYFLLKSELEERISPAIFRAMADINRDPRLSFRENGVIMTLPIRDILFLERNLKKTIIVHASGRKYLTTAKPSELLGNLPGSPFVQTHQSFYVNMEQVSGMEASGFILMDGQKVPISRRHRKSCKEAFFSMISRPLTTELL